MRPPARRSAFRVTAALLLLAAARPAPAAAQAQGGEEAPPHAWLFGEWTGGIFPAPTRVTAEACAAQPAVIFTRDTVLHATLTEPGFRQVAIAAVRATPDGAEFRLQPDSAQAAGAGFGCPDPEGLVVQRRGDNEILFPNCAGFPNPLIRCPGR